MHTSSAHPKPPAVRSIGQALFKTLVMGVLVVCAALMALRVYDIAAYAYRHPQRAPAPVTTSAATGQVAQPLASTLRP